MKCYIMFCVANLMTNMMMVFKIDPYNTDLPSTESRPYSTCPTCKCRSRIYRSHWHRPTLHADMWWDAITLLWRATCINILVTSRRMTQHQYLIIYGRCPSLCDHLDQSSVALLFLSMIDLDPSNMSCVHSTLQFICKHAARYWRHTYYCTFEHILLHFRPTTLVAIATGNRGSTRGLPTTLLRLGGFHTEMSFISSIGHLMVGSGLHELLETIYANNAATHMLTGRAVQSACRGLFLVD